MANTNRKVSSQTNPELGAEIHLIDDGAPSRASANPTSKKTRSRKRGGGNPRDKIAEAREPPRSAGAPALQSDTARVEQPAVQPQQTATSQPEPDRKVSDASAEKAGEDGKQPVTVEDVAALLPRTENALASSLQAATFGVAAVKYIVTEERNEVFQINLVPFAGADYRRDEITSLTKLPTPKNAGEFMFIDAYSGGFGSFLSPSDRSAIEEVLFSPNERLRYFGNFVRTLGVAAKLPSVYAQPTYDLTLSVVGPEHAENAVGSIFISQLPDNYATKLPNYRVGRADTDVRDAPSLVFVTDEIVADIESAIGLYHLTYTNPGILDAVYGLYVDKTSYTMDTVARSVDLSAADKKKGVVYRGASKFFVVNGTRVVPYTALFNTMCRYPASCRAYFDIGWNAAAFSFPEAKSSDARITRTSAGPDEWTSLSTVRPADAATFISQLVRMAAAGASRYFVMMYASALPYEMSRLYALLFALVLVPVRFFDLRSLADAIHSAFSSTLLGSGGSRTTNINTIMSALKGEVAIGADVTERKIYEAIMIARSEERWALYPPPVNVVVRGSFLGPRGLGNLPANFKSNYNVQKSVVEEIWQPFSHAMTSITRILSGLREGGRAKELPGVFPMSSVCSSAPYAFVHAYLTAYKAFNADLSMYPPNPQVPPKVPVDLSPLGALAFLRFGTDAVSVEDQKGTVFAIASTDLPKFSVSEFVDRFRQPWAFELFCSVVEWLRSQEGLRDDTLAVEKLTRLICLRICNVDMTPLLPIAEIIPAGNDYAHFFSYVVAPYLGVFSSRHHVPMTDGVFVNDHIPLLSRCSNVAYCGEPVDAFTLSAPDFCRWVPSGSASTKFARLVAHTMRTDGSLDEGLRPAEGTVFIKMPVRWSAREVMRNHTEAKEEATLKAVSLEGTLKFQPLELEEVYQVIPANKRVSLSIVPFSSGLCPILPYAYASNTPNASVVFSDSAGSLFEHGMYGESAKLALLYRTNFEYGMPRVSEHVK